MVELVVQVDELSKWFGKKQALDSVSFDMRQGEIVGYVGPNGSGKTTTMRILLNLLSSDGGQVRIFKHDVQREFAQIGPRVGVVLESHCLHPQLTVQETLTFYAELYELNRHQQRESIDWVSEQMGLAQVITARVKTLSKGLRQRVAFARSLVHRPDLLFLDEPFDGIDTETQRHLRKMVKRLAQENGMTIFLTSHDLHEVEQLADRVNILKNGRIIACDTTENLKRSLSHNNIHIHFQEPINAADLQRVLTKVGIDDAFQLLQDGYEAVIEMKNEEAANDLLAQFIAEGIRLREFVAVKSSLEDAYFNFMDE